MTKSRNILAQTLILGSIIPLGGDDSAVDVQMGDRNSVTRGATQTIASRMNQPDDKLSVNFYPEDPGHKVLAALEAAKDAELALNPAASAGHGAGSFIDRAAGLKYIWRDAIRTTPAAGIGGQETRTTTWNYDLVGAKCVPL